MAYEVITTDDTLDWGTLRYGILNNESDIHIGVDVVNLISPIVAPDNISTTIYGNSNTVILNYGIVFMNSQNINISNITFKNSKGDGVQFNNVNIGKVHHCFFVDHVTDSDECISAVKGCKNIEICFNGFKNVKKCILLGTGDGDDYLKDKDTIVSIHSNIFYEDIERRTPYGTGKVFFSGNWVMGWKYQGIQSFAFRLRQGGKGMIHNCIFDQTNSYWDGFPINQLYKGGANQAVTLEDDSQVLITDDNKFSPSWLVKTNSKVFPIFSNEELNQMYSYNGTLNNLPSYLIQNVGPK